jgi:hypothetical protein
MRHILIYINRLLEVCTARYLDVGTNLLDTLVKLGVQYFKQIKLFSGVLKLLYVILISRYC